MKAQGLQRALVVPGFVRSALDARKLMDAFIARPEYQKTEYMQWIDKAPLMAGKRKRLDQMLDELEKGNAYMGKPWTPPPPVAS
ncbi:MAG TPA: YdeI/OmpD-associated family protein [Kofleriaceae bacterium]